jgi:hypothetical protein
LNLPVKTPEASAELASRQRKLSQRHRTVLLLVDGRRTEEQVREMALKAGSPESCFSELVDLGMIAFSAPADIVYSQPMPLDELPPAAPADVPSQPAALAAIPEAEPEPDSVLSALPASLSLQFESSLNESTLNEPPSTDMSALDSLVREEGQDDALEEARGILIRAVRAEAPVAGSLTLLRLRRARSRADLEDLLEEVELRITKPFKGLWATQTMSRVRELLSIHSVS